MINAKLYLLLSCLLPAVCAIDYCNKTLCRTSKHIACHNSGKFSSKCALNAKIIPMSNDLKTQIVKRHNEYRNKIAGGFDKFSSAERMATMAWNSELSKLAEYNVKQCEMKHNECHNTDTFKYSGQNLYHSKWRGMAKSVPSVINKQIDSWFNEYKYCSMIYINHYADPSNGKEISHFTAMIQDKSTAVGCAILRQVNSDDFTEQFMACNYGFTNFMFNPVYATGKAASKCKTGVNKYYKFLCSPNEKY